MSEPTVQEALQTLQVAINAAANELGKSVFSRLCFPDIY